MKRVLLIAALTAALALAGAAWWHATHTLPQPTAPTPIEGQFELTAADNGKTFAYPLTSRFGVVLDSTRYDVSALSCNPPGMLGYISNIPAVELPLKAARFEVVATGTCELSTPGFNVRIVGTDTP